MSRTQMDVIDKLSNLPGTMSNVMKEMQTVAVEPKRKPSVFNIFHESMFAVSLSANSDDLPQRVDIPALWRPFRTFLYLTVFPSLAGPLCALHGWALARCACTVRWPQSTNIPKFEDRVTPEFVVYKRTYDHTRKKIIETTVSMDSDALKEALAVVGKRRSEYVDDGKGNSYFVTERQLINKAYMYRRERWAYAVLSDFIRYAVSAGICWLFFPAMRRFNADVFLWYKGGLPYQNIRHPVTNFFMSITDYNKAKHRIQSRGSLVNPVSSKPWTEIKLKQ